MCHIISSQEHLTKLCLWLNDHKPESCKVLGHVRSKLHGKFDCEVAVNSYDDPSVVVIQSSKEQIVKYIDNCATLFTTSPPDLVDFLQQENVLDWNMPMVFGGISLETAAVLNKHAHRYNGSVEVMDTYHILYCDDSLPTSCRTIRENFRMAPLSISHADSIVAEWKFSDEDALHFVRFLIANFPNIGIFDCASNKLVGWGLIQHYHAIGMLQVLPSYRREGIGQCIIQHLKQKLSALDLPKFAYTSTSNINSINFFNACEFVPYKSNVCWGKYKPKYSSA